VKRISIVVPIYNVEKFLKPCIDSVLGQDYNSYELILINDGSTDKSGFICDAYATNHSQIKVIHKKNEGLSEARNTGIRSASGQYIIFLDGDDFLLEHSLRDIEAYLSKHGDSDLILARLVRLYNNKHRVEDDITYHHISVPINYHSIDYMACLIKKGNMIWSSSATIYRRTFLIEHHIYFPKDVTCAEDFDFYFQAILAGQVIHVYNGAFICYRVGRQGSIMTKKNEASIYDTLFTYKKWFYNIREMTAKEQSKKIVCQMLSNAYVKKIHFIGLFGIREQKRLVQLVKRNQDIMYYKTDNLSIKKIKQIYKVLGIRFGAITLHTYYRFKKILKKQLPIEKHKGHQL
jgi:glycosyltransferase involved in cell wall biosynthesis